MSIQNLVTRAALTAALVSALAGCRVYASGSGSTTPASSPPPAEPAGGEVATRDHRGDSDRDGDHRGEGGYEGEDGGDTATPPTRSPGSVVVTDDRTPATPTRPTPPRRPVVTGPARDRYPVHPGVEVDPGHMRPGVGVIARDPARRFEQVTPFSIEPNAGPVGTGVTIYGNFKDVKQVEDVAIRFNGNQTATPIAVRPGSLTAIVPEGTRTGAVKVELKGRKVWTGSFRVTVGDGGILVPTPPEMGLIGTVWEIPKNTQKLPDFSKLRKPVAAVAVPDLTVAPRRFEAGFPGLSDKQNLLEWFAIKFQGKLIMDREATVYFQLNSDDGAKLYIDGELVVDNDGIHPPKRAEGGVRLGKGLHSIVVEYMQGPRYEIALELNWRMDDKAAWKPVPASVFRRY